MQNAILFVVLAISVNGFAQNKGPTIGLPFPSSRSNQNDQVKMEDERLLTSDIHSEINLAPIDKDLTQEKKWSFSLFGGFSFMGTGADIKNHMQESGFGDRRPGYDSWFGLGQIPYKDYPIKSTGMIWNFETRYNVSKKYALNFTAGKINHSSVEGYDLLYSAIWGNHGNYLRIKNDLWAASCNYIWRTGRRNDGISLGPVIARHITSVDIPYSYQVTSSTIKTGFNLGYTLSFVQKRYWFLTCKAIYTWLPDSIIGPFTNESFGQGDTSVFKETHVRLSTLNFGIAAGWRL